MLPHTCMRTAAPSDSEIPVSLYSLLTFDDKKDWIFSSLSFDSLFENEIDLKKIHNFGYSKSGGGRKCIHSCSDSKA